MRAAIIDAPHTMHLGELETPQAGPGQVLVAVKAAGVCAGDMYIYVGKNPYVQYPVVAGHEIAGTVMGVGADVSGLEPDALVVVEPFLSCGHCYPCRMGKGNCCANLRIIGAHQPGGYAEYVCAPAANIHRVPPGMTPQTASFAEPVAVAIQACRRGNVSAGEEVLILGCGPIGLALIEVVRARGARAVAADIEPARLATAASLGADVLPAGPELVDRVLERTHGEGAPVVIEATGNLQAAEQTVDLVAAGGRIVIVGLFKRGLSLTLPALDLTRKEMTILGSRASVNCFPEALQLLASGAIHYPSVATDFSLWDAPGVFARLADDPAAVHKAVLTL